MSVFSGSSDSDTTYPVPGTRQPKEQTCTVVPPTAEGAGSHYDYTVLASSGGEERADPDVSAIVKYVSVYNNNLMRVCIQFACGL